MKLRKFVILGNTGMWFWECMFSWLLRIFWQRLLGKKVIFITGTDEHGEKIATAAAANGSSPSEHCDVIAQSYRTLWKDVIFL